MSIFGDIVAEARADMGWDDATTIDLLTDFLDAMIHEGYGLTGELHDFIRARIAEQIQRAKEESEAGDLEMAGCFITCPVCGSAGHPDAVHKGECHAHLSTG